MRKIVSAVLALTIVMTVESWANVIGKDNRFEGKSAPRFSTADMRGERCALEDLLKHSRVVVVNFWGLRCAACIQEMPHLNALYNRYKDRIVVLGINVDGVDGPFLKDAIRDLGFTVDYRLLPDPDFRLADMFKMKAAPLTMVIDSAGIVRYQHEDYKAGDEKRIEAAITGILGETASSSK